MAIYRDINLSFDRHPLTGDVLVATDTEAIKKSLRTLIQLNLYDVPFDPEKGTNLRASLFENFSPITVEFLRSKIQELVREREPRVLIQKIMIYQREDSHRLEVNIYFKIKDLNTLEELTVFVERTR